MTADDRLRTGYSRRAVLAQMGAVSAWMAHGLLRGAAADAQAAVAKQVPGPRVKLNVREFGARGDGAVKDTAAFQQAIDRCAVLGGGEVVVPQGRYLIGSVALRSRVTLRLDQDSVLVGSPEFGDYPVTQVRWEGKWIQGHIGLLYAIDAEDVAIVGPGRVEGNPGLGGRPNKENPLRHPALIEFVRVSRIRLEGFSTSYNRMWSVHPSNCSDVMIRNLTIRSTGGNGDGIDVDSCKRVWIDGCDIATGDDCISLKSGRGEEAFTLLQTTEDVRITNCTFADSIFACIGIGSETSGGIRQVRIEHCRFEGAQTHAIYIKSRVGRGAFVEDVSVEDVEASNMRLGFLRINQTNSGLQDEQPVPGLDGIPLFRNLVFRKVRVHNAPVLVQADEIHPDKPLDGFVLQDVSGTCAKGILLANARRVNLSRIGVTGYSGPLLSTVNVTGKGLQDAAALPRPKVPEPIPSPAKAYELH